MQTLREVLRKKEERQNLNSVGFCVLIVLLLVFGTFTMVSIKHMVENRPSVARKMSPEPNVSAFLAEIK
ncbi:MAG: hypothetical protein O2954_06615 [bacterium]|nr:hypothetical protein [bacterium]